MKILMILLIFSSIVSAQEQEAKPKSFNTLLSLGYTPLEGETLFMGIYRGTNSTNEVNSSGIKQYDFDSTTSSLTGKITYGISDATGFSLDFRNVISQSNVTTYTAAAKTSGKIDSTVNKKGFDDPKISVTRVLKQSDTLKVVGEISYSPSLGKAKAESVNSGGDSFGVKFGFTKSIKRAEFTLNFGYESKQKTTGEGSNYTYESKGGSSTDILFGINYFLNEESTIGLLYEKTNFESDVYTYSSNPDQLKVDPYGASSIGAYFQYALESDMIFIAGINSISSESTDFTQGTGTGRISALSGKTGVVGLNLKF